MSVERRDLLAAIAAGGGISGSGCVHRFSDHSVQLGMYAVYNMNTDSAHEYDLEVLRDGEVVHSSTQTVQPARRLEDGGSHAYAAVADCDWGDVAGDYVVRARADGGGWVERSVTEFADSRNVDCLLMQANHRDGIRFTPYQGCDRDFDPKCSFAEER